MAGIFGGGAAAKQKLPEVKPTRMPTETDPTIVAAAERTRKKIGSRKGRQSTMMTDSISESMIGSSGKSLGA
jgi:hypothetical protein